MPCDKVETAKAWRDANVQPRINATEAATMDAPTASPKGKAESAARHRSGEGAGSDRLYWLSRGRREKAEAERAISMASLTDAQRLSRLDDLERDPAIANFWLAFADVTPLRERTETDE